MNYNLYLLFIGFCFFILINACKTTKTQTTSALSFAIEIKPVIDMNCARSCDKTTLPAANTNHSLNGKLLAAIQHLEGAVAMPKKNTKMNDASIKTIVDWANSGINI